MTTIAHLTDLHLIEDGHQLRPSATRARLSFLSFGRPLDAVARRERFARALADAWASLPDHLLLTGDLTEDGTEAQFEVLAEMLGESRFSPETVTLVPGNHDAYDGPRAWERALEGPLKPYARSSALGKVIALREVDLVPVSTAFHQNFTRSAGAIAKTEIDRLSEVVGSKAERARPLVIAQHHPPGAHSVPLMNWIDGLQEHALLTEILNRSAQLFVVHGHTHRKKDRPFGAEPTPRIFSAEAVVESRAPLRLYEASSRGLSPVFDEASSGVTAEAVAVM